VFSVDGRELARKTIAHTIPLMMTIGETFAVGVDILLAMEDITARSPNRPGRFK
jgi:hypothetical protein